MKKFIFLLLMVVTLVGFVLAQDAAYPPLDIQITQDAVLSGCCVDCYTATLDTVLADSEAVSLQPAGVMARLTVMAGLRTGWIETDAGQKAGYWLLL